jgi:hypothetical protein
MENKDQQANLYKPTAQFEKKLDQIKSSDPTGHGRIKKVIARLLLKPADADGKMRGIYHGRFKKYVGRREYRIVYYWCERCRKENRRLEKTCTDCEKLPDKSVIFFDLYHKKDMKKFKKN